MDSPDDRDPLNANEGKGLAVAVPHLEAWFDSLANAIHPLVERP